MILLDYIIIAALVYLVFSLFFKQKENFETRAHNTNITEYNPVNRNIPYNKEYILNNFSKMLYEFTMDIERQSQNSSTITPSIDIEEESFDQASLLKRQHHVDKIIKMLNNMFNEPLAVVEFDKSYGIKEAFGNGKIYLLFKVNVTPEFTAYVKEHQKEQETEVIGVSNELKFEIYNTIFLALDIRYKVYQLRLFNVESIDAHAVNGHDKNEIKSDNLNYTEESNLNLSESQIKEVAQDYVEKNHKEDEGKCFIRSGVDDKIEFDVNCKLNGGIWDTPCKNNEECPFYDGNNGKCNEDSGYCEMPQGTNNISFKKYEGTPEIRNNGLIF